MGVAARSAKSPSRTLISCDGLFHSTALAMHTSLVLVAANPFQRDRQWPKPNLPNNYLQDQIDRFLVAAEALHKSMQIITASTIARFVRSMSRCVSRLRR
jgi:diphthamide synthase subunit DPH2